MSEHLIYLANNRLPTEKAHGLQIVQNCEALADAGYAVTLVTPRRINTPELRRVASLWAHYGVKRNFAFHRLPCLDLFALFPRYHVAFITQTITYLLALLLWLPFRRRDVLYTRDVFVAFTLALLRPLLWRRAKLVYEVHQVHESRTGRWMQGFVARRAFVVAITGHLAQHMRDLGARRVQIEHDGFRAARFENLPSRQDARAAVGLPPDAFVVGYVGRLHTMGMSKGLDTLVSALASIDPDAAAIHLLLVGGPAEGVAQLRRAWKEHGLPAARLHAVGQVAPDAVPRYLAAMDVGVMPLPWMEHFAYSASALKLFEYMAGGCAVVASDLPSTAEVVQHGDTALLVPPGDAGALAAALRQLATDPDLCARLGQRAQAAAQHYAWDRRAARIRNFIGEEP